MTFKYTLPLVSSNWILNYKIINYEDTKKLLEIIRNDEVLVED